MASNKKEVLLIGFGAVGAVYAWVMQNSGKARVTVIARSNKKAVETSGLDLHSKKYGTHNGWKPDRICGSIEEALDVEYDYVVMTTKCIPEQTPTTKLVASFLSAPYVDQHPQPTYVFMQNGINIEAGLYKKLKELQPNKEPKIISAIMWIGADSLNATTVEHENMDNVTLGVYRPIPTTTKNTPEEEALVQGFADILSTGGTGVTVVPEMHRQRFTKNIFNATFGFISAIVQLDPCSIFTAEPEKGPNQPPPNSDPLPEDALPSAQATASLYSASPAIRAFTLPFIYDAMNEIYSLGKAIFPPDEDGKPALNPDMVNNTLKFVSDNYGGKAFQHKTSTQIDAELGRPMEVEVIVGELVRLGRRKNVAMPRMEAIYGLALIKQNDLLRRSSRK